MFFLWLRRLVLGEIDGGGFGGNLNLYAGVRGGSIAVESKGRVGEEDGNEDATRGRERTLVGLISRDEERMRAISSSARPRLILDRPGSRSGSTG